MPIPIQFRISKDEMNKTGFTLIELLVVIAIIAILAALVVPGSRLAAAARTKSRARAELREVESFIELYKIKSNFYPPCSPINDPKMNCLYYELAGTRLTNSVYTTLNGAAQIKTPDIHIAFLLDGFANAAQGVGDDNVQQPRDFVSRSLRGGQFLEVFVTNAPLSASARVVVLGSSLAGGDMLPGTSGGKINPFGYNSATPSHNPNSFDLWLDVLVGGATNRICNWSDKPIRL
jgi:prepilin-type N-terminal cleavage/methylation domain-containing protein